MFTNLSFSENFILGLIFAFCLATMGFGFSSMAIADDDHGTHAANPWTADTALQALKDGNERVVQGNLTHPNLTPDVKQKLAKEGQFPLAIILSCSDSRAPIEDIFDMGFGDIFSIRVAGAVPGVDQLGSIEYAVDHLGVPIIMVLAHTQCGAVTAAVDGGEVPGNLGALLQQLSPVAKLVEQLPEEKRLEAAIATSSVYFRDQLVKLSPIIAEAVKTNHVKIVSGVYDISTGAVSFDK
ncbi:MAG: carbonic anhydrase [Deltaproteobacteria bacterium]|jgi:carbonic anhydrase|nr:carbonic anhydrase [Deltaproteobacteria bacterium]